MSLRRPPLFLKDVPRTTTATQSRSGRRRSSGEFASPVNKWTGRLYSSQRVGEDGEKSNPDIGCVSQSGKDMAVGAKNSLPDGATESCVQDKEKIVYFANTGQLVSIRGKRRLL